MKTHTLTYSCPLNAAVEAVCHFHTDTHNLPLITPPWINVEILSMDEPMIEKSQVKLKIKRFGIATVWHMEIEKLDCPNTVVDTMISGPFQKFRHERIFIHLDETHSQMKETISIVLPMGWLGSLIFPFIKKDMDKMFAYRHEATRRYFEVDTPPRKQGELFLHSS